MTIAALTLEEWRVVLVEVAADRPSCDPLVVKLRGIIAALEASK